MLPLIDQSWQLDFVIWAIPVLLIAVVTVVFAPPRPPLSAAAALASRRWFPDFRNPLIWRVGLLLGSVNAAYFAMNGFLPDYMTRTGHPELIHGALTALNLGQIPASFLLLASADRMVRTVWSYLTCGIVCLGCVLAIVLVGGIWTVVAATVFGCFAAAVLVLILALPPLISPPDEVHLTAAGVFTISYTCAVVIPIVSGIAWDFTGWPTAAFIPIMGCMIAVVGLSPTVVLRDKSAGT